jgi:hypothetical protein
MCLTYSTEGGGLKPPKPPLESANAMMDNLAGRVRPREERGLPDTNCSISAPRSSPRPRELGVIHSSCTLYMIGVLLLKNIQLRMLSVSCIISKMYNCYSTFQSGIRISFTSCYAAFHNQVHFYIETIKNLLENNYSL